MSIGYWSRPKQRPTQRYPPNAVIDSIEPWITSLALCIFMFAAHSGLGQDLDSTKSQAGPTRWRIMSGTLSGSYTTSRNYQAEDFRNLAFTGGVFFQDDLKGQTRRHSHKLLADLSMLKFIDSTWTKGNDRLQANLLWCMTDQKWSHAYSVVLATQFLPNEHLVYDPEDGSPHIARYGGFLAPAALELCYGGTWTPWPLSTIQFGFATARFISTPKVSLQPPDREHLAETSKSVFDMQYGGSVVVAINHPLTDRIDWINSSRFFCNAFDRDHVSMDFMNRFCIKLWKYLQLRVESRAAYDPMVSYNIKFSQEFLLGVYYERR